MAEVIYTVTVRGNIPADIVETVSQAHARAINGGPSLDEKRGVSNKREKPGGRPVKDGQKKAEP